MRFHIWRLKIITKISQVRRYMVNAYSRLVYFKCFWINPSNSFPLMMLSTTPFALCLNPRLVAKL